MKTGREFASTLFYVLSGVVAAFLINQGLALALNTDMPLVAVESNSMIPTFYKGDILVLLGTSAKDLKIGDIIVFSVPSYSVPVVHRVVKINDDGTFQTKGDANLGQLSFEKMVNPEQIHGKEILIVPYLGWVKILMAELIIPNMLYVITALLVVFAAYELGYKNLRVKS